MTDLVPGTKAYMELQYSQLSRMDASLLCEFIDAIDADIKKREGILGQVAFAFKKKSSIIPKPTLLAWREEACRAAVQSYETLLATHKTDDYKQDGLVNLLREITAFKVTYVAHDPCMSGEVQSFVDLVIERIKARLLMSMHQFVEECKHSPQHVHAAELLTSNIWDGPPRELGRTCVEYMVAFRQWSERLLSTIRDLFGWASIYTKATALWRNFSTLKELAVSEYPPMSSDVLNEFVQTNLRPLIRRLRRDMSRAVDLLEETFMVTCAPFASKYPLGMQSIRPFLEYPPEMYPARVQDVFVVGATATLNSRAQWLLYAARAKQLYLPPSFPFWVNVVGGLRLEVESQDQYLELMEAFEVHVVSMEKLLKDVRTIYRSMVNCEDGIDVLRGRPTRVATFVEPFAGRG